MAPSNEDAERLAKKAKKAERKKAEQAASEAAPVEAAAEEKVSKKEKKRLREAAAEAAAADEPSAAPASAAEGDEGASSGKKQRKQEKAAAAAAAAAEAAPAAGGESSKKKKVKVDAAASDAPPAMASVGDAEIARTGKAVIKMLYKQHADITKMTEDQVIAVRAERATAVEGSDMRPVLQFSHTGLPAAMLHATSAFSAPSPIQAQCWPIVLSGLDLIGIAATGSGKTLAFGLPMLRHIVAQRDAGVVKGKGPFALAMAPTRELACQISDVIQDSGSQCGVRCVTVYGGVPKKEQLAALRRGVEVVVGTPGRLEDLMNDGACQLNEVTYLVLDEADRMLDLGFEPHIRAICGKVRSDRQTLMFSATWPSAVQKLASNFLNGAPVKVTVGSADLSASHSISQVVEVLELHQRDNRLLELLQQYHKSRTNRVLIFVLYKKEAPKVEALLARRGWTAASIHGDISQVQRTAAVEHFKSGKVPLLIATDVAARGLDIPDVEVVINYSFPLTTEDYVHRIGRTGRAGKTGVAHTFFCASMDKPRSGELINVLKEAGQPVPDSLLAFGTAVKKKESSMYGAHFKDVAFGVKATKTTFDDDE